MKSFASLVGRVVGFFYTPGAFKTNYLTDIRWERLRKTLRAIQERNVCLQGEWLLNLAFLSTDRRFS